MIPAYIKDIIAKKHTPEEVALIEGNWLYYADQHFRFSSATKSQILFEAGLVLDCVKQGGDLSESN